MSPLSEAAVLLPAALLLAGTLFPTSHPRHGPSTFAASTIRGCGHGMPVLALSLQPDSPSRVFPRCCRGVAEPRPLRVSWPPPVSTGRLPYPEVGRDGLR